MFSCEVFFRGVEGSNKVWTSETSLSVSRQDFVKHILMRNQCLLFMLSLAALERTEKNPLKIKFRKDVVELYKPIVWTELSEKKKNLSYTHITLLLSQFSFL